MIITGVSGACGGWVGSSTLGEQTTLDGGMPESEKVASLPRHCYRMLGPHMRVGKADTQVEPQEITIVQSHFL